MIHIEPHVEAVSLSKNFEDVDDLRPGERPLFLPHRECHRAGEGGPGLLRCRLRAPGRYRRGHPSADERSLSFQALHRRPDAPLRGRHVHLEACGGPFDLYSVPGDPDRGVPGL